MKITLYDLFDLCKLSDVDIADNTYDFMVNFGCHVRKCDCKDFYDKCMRFFATKIECDDFEIGDNIAHCDIVKFINKFIDVFNEFMNRHNREGYRPKDFALVDKDDPTYDDIFYDIYMNTFNSMVVGNYSEEQYRDLFTALKIFVGE